MNLDSLRTELAVDAILLTDPADVRWACGFTGSNGWLVIGPNGKDFLTDGRYTIQASREVRDARVHVPGYDLAAFLARSGIVDDGARIAYRSDVVSVSDLRSLEAELESATFVGVDRILSSRRAVKTADEVTAIVAAQRITESVFNELLGIIHPGVTERDIASEIVYRQLRGGAERMSFDPIVASGPNSALPHARPGDRVIQAGDPVLLDFGCVVDGYASDMTRMVCVGTPPADFASVAGIVRDALDRAVDAARHGMRADRLDAAARDVISASGYGEAFSHSLGHGVGLDVHEWPGVSWRNEQDLPAGCVVTIEPGIYLEGRFGVRIEDMIYLGADGTRVLTGISRDVVHL